jgi:hypothetical protein
MEYIQRSEEPYNRIEMRANSMFFSSYMNITFILGIILMVAYIWNLALTVLLQSNLRICDRDWIQFWLATSNTIGESRIKKVSSHLLLFCVHDHTIFSGC